MGLVHDAHAALAERPDDPITAEARARPKSDEAHAQSSTRFLVDIQSRRSLSSVAHGGDVPKMKVLCVHPSGLMYTEIFLRLEPLGVELVAASLRRAGHDVRLCDLQADSHKDYFKLLAEFEPEVVCFGVNYLANIPEVIDPQTGQTVPDGQAGELVITNLGRWGSPLLRYRTNDRVRLTRNGQCACGRWYARPGRSRSASR